MKTKKPTRSEKLRIAAEPLMKLLNEDYHPHCKIILTNTSIEVVEGVVSIPEIYDYLVDV